MSLYYETATILANPDKVGGSFKARIFKKKDLKSKPGQIYALVAEASKWSKVLKDVIEKCGVLGEERKLSPILALLLTHDLLLSKSGVAAHKDHVLRLAITRHKARLSAEFTKARIKHGFPTLEAFREAINNDDLEDEDDEQKATRHPRWVRINTLKTSLEEQLSTTFKAYSPASSIGDVLTARGSQKLYFKDPHIPNLLALPSRIDLTKTPAYTTGALIFQDKASCFPAYLLDLSLTDGTVIDGCAAPGNKTTHTAALVSPSQKVIAFERDKGRTLILQKMVKLAGADSIVTVKGSSDFIAAKPNAEEFANVGAILLDPSCSGTGIVGRDDAIKLHLPSSSPTSSTPAPGAGKNKKRKRATSPKPADSKPAASKTEMTLTLDESTQEETPLSASDALTDRLTALSTFQLHILTHALRFPSARKITYSTCSIHFQENEAVVFSALATSIAKERGWRILKRSEQVEGLRTWERRGVWEEGVLGAEVGMHGREAEREDVLQGCVRCEKGTGEGTMGFFVAGFVRNGEGEDGEGEVENMRGDAEETVMGKAVDQEAIAGDKDEEWDGFSDEEKPEEVVEEKESAPQPSKSSSKKKRKTGKH